MPEDDLLRIQKVKDAVAQLDEGAITYGKFVDYVDSLVREEEWTGDAKL